MKVINLNPKLFWKGYHLKGKIVVSLKKGATQTP